MAIALYCLKTFFHYSPTWVNWLNDVLTMPVMFIITHWCMRFLYGNRFTLSYTVLFIATGCIAILFELIFPYLSHQCTADALDVVWYFTGTLLYTFMQRYKPNVNQQIVSALQHQPYQ